MTPMGLRWIGLIALLAICVLLSLRLGAVTVGWEDLVGLITDSPGPRTDIVLRYRLPRTVAAVVIGCYLGLSGLLFQTVLRNPLADPTLFGVSGGAALAVVGAMAAIAALPPQVGPAFLPMSAIPVIALVGGLVATASVLVLAGRRGFSPMRMILTGVVVAAVLNAVVMAMVLGLSEGRTDMAILWLAGSLYARSFDNILPALPWGLAALAMLLVLRRPLAILRFDPDMARALGVAVGPVSLMVLAIAAGLAASAVSIAGTVGFVGLIVPHVVRRIIGPGIGAHLWASALVGAILVTAADTFGRVVAAPLEIPVGMTTSLIGAPVLAFLLRARNTQDTT